MLALRPRGVRVMGVALDDVESIAIERRATRVAEEWTDAGPHVAFVDVAEQRVSATIVRAPAGDAADLFRPGQQGTVEFEASANLSGGHRGGARRFIATGVVVETSFGAHGEKGARQRIALTLVSADGLSDPLMEVGP